MTATFPQEPENANRTHAIPDADPRLTYRRVLEGYSKPANGNFTPRYLWELLVDGLAFDFMFARERDLMDEARTNGEAYLVEAAEMTHQAQVEADSPTPVPASREEIDTYWNNTHTIKGNR